MKPSSGTYRALNRALGKAVHRYEMIADGDRIAVGVSGGKDSLALLWALQERQSRVPIAYELFPIHIDPGFEGGFSDALQEFCGDMGFSLRVEHTDCGLRAHSDENRENPCFLCSRLRRKRLFEVSDQLGCRKLALGHHKDDIIETLFINMFYAGAISTMRPSQRFFDGRFSVIRPLAFVDEDVIRRFAREKEFPEYVNPCPSAHHSRRSGVKEMLNRLYRENRKVKGNIFRSMSRPMTGCLLD